MLKYTYAQDKVFTHFYDMHSGGYQKLSHAVIVIEAPKQEAIEIFKSIFKRDPHNITCDCCGADYAIDEDDTRVSKHWIGGGVLFISEE